MPYELYTDDIYTFDKMKDIPPEFYTTATSFEAVDMNLTSITNIGLKFPNLERLVVGCNNIKILDLSYFHNLKILRCNKNKISKIIGFEYCHKLEEVEIACNQIESINSNHNLKLLCIGENLLTELPDFNNLEALDVSGNKLLKSIGDYPKLNTLCINHTLITNLTLYMNLKFLECSNSKIASLEPYPKLEILEIINCPLKKKDLPYLPSIDMIIDKKTKYID